MGAAAAGAPGAGYGPGPSQGPADTESRVPVINLKDGTRLAGDDAPRRRELDQWLREHPGFVADTGAFIPVSRTLCSASSSGCAPNPVWERGPS
jgi:hypothetical protein